MRPVKPLLMFNLPLRPLLPRSFILGFYIIDWTVTLYNKRRIQRKYGRQATGMGAAAAWGQRWRRRAGTLNHGLCEVHWGSIG